MDINFTMKFCLFILVFKALNINCFEQSSYHESGRPGHGKCEEIVNEICKPMQYNVTIFPNLLGHTNQQDAGMEIHQYVTLIKNKCSPDIALFLCTVFFPVCTILDYPIPPCRNLCESAKLCEKLMNTWNFKWPENLECTKYPEPDKNMLCVGENTTTSTQPPTLSENTPKIFNTANNNIDSKKHREIGFVCPLQLKTPSGTGYALYINNVKHINCGIPCHALFFDQEQKSVLRYWVGSWAVVCCMSCLFTVLTFLIDSSRFRYPERPIVFLAICYLIVGCAFIKGLGAGDTIACREPYPSPGRNIAMSPTITMGLRHSSSCTIIFMALYFCSMAAFAWWMCLALAWFLAAGLKWGHEAITAKSHLFHTVAWTIPAVQTIFVLALGKVEGDVLSGVCFLGQLDPHALAWFLIVPLCIYLSIGAIFLLAGFVSLFRIRTVMKHDGTRTDKLERLMIRIGIFSGVFIIPAVGYLACLFYEYYNFDNWMVQWNLDICRKFSIPCPTKRHIDRPNFMIYLAKYVCSMLVGVTSSVWLWSGKTILSWQMFAQRLQGKVPRSRGNYV